MSVDFGLALRNVYGCDQAIVKAPWRTEPGWVWAPDYGQYWATTRHFNEVSSLSVIEHQYHTFENDTRESFCGLELFLRKGESIPDLALCVRVAPAGKDLDTTIRALSMRSEWQRTFHVGCDYFGGEAREKRPDGFLWFANQDRGELYSATFIPIYGQEMLDNVVKHSRMFTERGWR